MLYCLLPRLTKTSRLPNTSQLLQCFPPVLLSKTRLQRNLAQWDLCLMLSMDLQVGKDLEEAYWRPGNGAAFLDLVHQLTGEPLSADAWVNKLQESVSSVVQQEEQDYQQAVKMGPKLRPGQWLTVPTTVSLLQLMLILYCCWLYRTWSGEEGEGVTNREKRRCQEHCSYCLVLMLAPASKKQHCLLSWPT